MKIVITRTNDNGKQTIGYFNIYDDSGILKFSCCTLELPDKGNQKNISCIPRGTYLIEPRFSETYDNHFHVKNVPNRSWILIHFGNYRHNTEGCILVGEDFKYINNDNLLDVSNSKNTLSKIVQILGNKTHILQVI